MLVKILVLASTLAVLLVNYFSAIGMINNRDAGQISANYPTEITPAGYAFSIWSLIYLGMIAFSIYQLVVKDVSSQLESVRLPYILLCLANISWVFLWHYEVLPVSLGVIFVMLALLALINTRLINLENPIETIVAGFPFSLYFGWVTIASVLNFTITLVYSGITFSAYTTAIVAALVIVVATVIGVMVRFGIDRMGYPLAMAWGITAIGIEQSGDTLVVAVTAFSMMALIFVALWGFVKDR